MEIVPMRLEQIYFFKQKKNSNAKRAQRNVSHKYFNKIVLETFFLVLFVSIYIINLFVYNHTKKVVAREKNRNKNIWFQSNDQKMC